MNPDPSKLRHQHKQVEQTADVQLGQEGQAARVFGSPEELIRFDTARTPAPESIAERLLESIALEKKPARSSWWRRLFGRAE
jgi:hypothetical protein